jgi:hypothetical protein
MFIMSGEFQKVRDAAGIGRFNSLFPTMASVTRQPLS